MLTSVFCSLGSSTFARSSLAVCFRSSPGWYSFVLIGYKKVSILGKTGFPTSHFTHLNISLDHPKLWLRCAFVVALFQEAYAMSQHLFPLRLALVFCRDLVLTTGETKRSVRSSSAHPKDFEFHMNLSIVILEYAHANRRVKKKSIDGITWTCSAFR